MAPAPPPARPARSSRRLCLSPPRLAARELGRDSLLVIVALGGARLRGDWSVDYSAPGSESKDAARPAVRRFPSAGRRHRLEAFAAGALAPAVEPEDRPVHRPCRRQARRRRRPSAGAAPISRDGDDRGRAAAADGLHRCGARRTGDDRRTWPSRPPRRGPAGGAGRAGDRGALRGEVGSEGIGFAIATVILLLTFGWLVALGLPLPTALFGLGISTALSARSPRSSTRPTGPIRSRR